jgi:predicted Rossmann-fold nucleotide-binding protein
LELMMIWQLLQVRHLDMPLILVGKMWRGLVDWAKTNLATSQPRLVNPEDIDIPRCVDGADEALELIREHHAQWLSGGNADRQ